MKYEALSFKTKTFYACNNPDKYAKDFPGLLFLTVRSRAQWARNGKILQEIGPFQAFSFEKLKKKR